MRKYTGLKPQCLSVCPRAMQYNTVQYKNDFYSAVIEDAEALVGRL